MLSSAARARLAVVLVGARNPSNIGAAARAMQDFGFSDLRVVNDYAAPFEAAQLQADSPAMKSAVAAHHVLRNARRFDTLAAAIADCTLIVGTTAVGEREIKQPILTLPQAAPLILQAMNTTQLPPSAQNSAQHRIALLFGSEKTGLTNDQLSHCSLLTTIPMFSPKAESGPDRPPRHLSMNLGQSVAVCLYELTRSGFEDAKPLPPVSSPPPATAADRERLTQLLLDLLHAPGYTRRFPANASEPLIRQLTQQLGVTHREAMTWMGILRQILWRERERAAPETHS